VKYLIHERDEILQNLAEVERFILKNLWNFTEKFSLQVLTEVGLNIILFRALRTTPKKCSTGVGSGLSHQTLDQAVKACQ
jgi:hypothetical protein